MRLRWLFVLWFSLGFGLASARTAPAQDIDKARAEAEVVWYTNLNTDASLKIAKAFEAKYPFLQVKTYRAGNDGLVRRIVAEALAGKPKHDVSDMTLTFITELLKKNLVVPYDSPERRYFPDDFKDKKGFWTGTTVQASVMGYNTQLVPAQEAPKSYEDFLQPRWKGGKITIDSQAYEWFQMMLSQKGKDETFRFIKGLMAQKPVFNRGRTHQAQLVVAGEYEAALELFNYRVEVLKSKGAPIEWVAPKPMVTNPSVAFLPPDPPHPNAGKLFLNFLLSKEGATQIRNTGRIPARGDVDPDPPKLLKGIRVWVPDPQDDINEVIKLYNEAFGITAGGAR